MAGMENFNSSFTSVQEPLESFVMSAGHKGHLPKKRSWNQVGTKGGSFSIVFSLMKCS